MKRMHKRAKQLALLGGAGAVVTLGTLGFGHTGGAAPTSLAGSGDAPTGTVYVQPTVIGMTLGSTSTVETAAPAKSG